MVMFLVAGGLEVTMVLLQVRRFDQSLLAQEIERAVHRGKTDTVATLPGDLEDLVRAEMPGLLANDLQDSFTLAREAAPG